MRALRWKGRDGSSADCGAVVARVLLTDLRGGRSARRAAAEDRSRGVLSACRADALVAELRGLSCGAARGRAGRRDTAEIRQKDPSRARAAEPHIDTAPRPFGGAARTVADFL
ncbi:hypothetical protein SVIO_044020 [Streptomyces violaceusniger]|uniref:Uncharacterized protein n=1 Tax=Streptomyces violaceusniger TaxID=68280 RepID=A0A4D4L6Y5_STRVO|nr:hypothetical protein SVIO_044020 [Streptomyces violaceusniger]